MGNDVLVIRAWLRSAIRASKASGKPLSQVLDDINAAIMGNGIQNGQVVIATSEAGGTISMALPTGHTPLELAALNEEAIAYCAQCPDPEVPNITTRRIKRLRFGFANAVPC